MHPLVCLRSIESVGADLTALPIFGRKASGLRSRHCIIAFWRSFSFSRLLEQFVQLQPLQNSPFAKQSQYNFKHCDLEQLQVFFWGTSFSLIEFGALNEGVKAPLGDGGAGSCIKCVLGFVELAVDMGINKILTALAPACEDCCDDCCCCSCSCC